MCLRNGTWCVLEKADDGKIELRVGKVNINGAPAGCAGECKAQLELRVSTIGESGML